MNTIDMKQVRNWIYRNARNLEITLWNYYFEQGDKEAVVDTLMEYQNEDGGFGHALEADNWNPNSNPVSMQTALNILKDIKFNDMEHPIYQGIWKYLKSEAGLLEYGWAFTITSTDSYPHAPWWNYSEESNQKEYFGVTADLSAFILLHGDKETAIYQKALGLAEALLETLQSDETYGDMGIEGFIRLVDVMKHLELQNYDYKKIEQVLSGKVKHAIEHDTSKWKFYGVRPSNYIHSEDSMFYQENKDIVREELNYLMETKPSDDVWGITWTWFDNMEQYAKEFAITENWWKGTKAIEKMLFLRSFHMI